MSGDSLVLGGRPGILTGLTENDDIALTCNGGTATGSDVRFTGSPGYVLTLTKQDDGTITVGLVIPGTQDSCEEILDRG